MSSSYDVVPHSAFIFPHSVSIFPYSAFIYLRENPPPNHILIDFGTKAVEQHFKTSGISILRGKRKPDQKASVLSQVEGKGKQKKRVRAPKPKGANGGNQAEAGQAQEEIVVQDSNAKALALKFM